MNKNIIRNLCWLINYRQVTDVLDYQENKETITYKGHNEEGHYSDPDHIDCVSVTIPISLLDTDEKHFNTAFIKQLEIKRKADKLISEITSYEELIKHKQEILKLLYEEV